MKDENKILDLLRSDHSELDGLLDAAFAALETAETQRIFDCIDLFWARLAMHIRTEHVRLFPVVSTIAAGSVGGDEILTTLAKLHTDHDFFMRELARLIKAMRLVFHFGNEAQTFVIVRERLEAVRARLEIHNQVEEEGIYTLVAKKNLGGTETEELIAAVQKELNNIPPRFRPLAKPV